MLSKAIALASEAHKNQFDKQGEPYILHPIRVMMSLRQDGFPPLYQAVGVLHDVVEDTSITIQQIEAEFGKLVSVPLEFLTHQEHVTYFQYIRNIRDNPIALEVKKRDIIDNADFRRFFQKVKYDKYAKAMGILMGQRK